MKKIVLVAVFALLLAGFYSYSSHKTTAAGETVGWSNILKQDQAWYKTTEALRIADNVLLYQRNNGGWGKNTDMAAVLTQQQKDAISSDKDKKDTTIDNSATTTQMIFLAKVYALSGVTKYRDAFENGLDYLLEAQYENGGWPQFYPDTTAYYKYITFNDNAMVNVLNLLRDISGQKTEYGFISGQKRAEVTDAVARGTALIVKIQIVANGIRTGWCAQYDNITLEPAKARTYELPSISGHETAAIVRFLMGIPDPEREVLETIESAVSWLEKSKITGIRVVEKQDSSLPGGYDMVVVQDSSAPPLWARFYEIDTNRPFFCGRDGIKKFSLAEIELERRTGYTWYVTTPSKLLGTDYPAWKKMQIAPAPYFSDISGHWAEYAILDTVARSIVNTPRGEAFRPEDPISRAEFAAMIARALSLAAPGSARYFNDVTNLDWFYEEVNAVAANGIIQGPGDGNYYPGRAISRYEAMVTLFRAMRKAGKTLTVTPDESERILSGFSDTGNIPAWAVSEAAICVREGIVTGYNGRLNGSKQITRAETTAIIKRMLEKTGL